MTLFKHLFTLAILMLLVAVLPATAQEATPEPLTDYPNAQLLVDTAWLADHLQDPTITIVDMRAADDYAQEHIPGAVNLPVSAIASTVDGIPMEVNVDQVRQALGSVGLTPEATVVIYDDLGMMNSARLFWTLEYLGHNDTRILDGGWNAWVAEGLPTTDETPDIEPTDYAVAMDESKLISADELLERLDDPDLVIVDARSPQEYTGEVRLSERGGHIPGALLFTWLDALTGGDTVYTIERGWQAELQDEDVEVFRSPAEIDALLRDLGLSPEQEIATYCHTLWRGAHVYFLLRLMGYDNVRGYDGSWAEWGNRDDLPIVTGDQPGTLADAETA